jgi:ADP-ribose pyrophosphatase YjhB (NUDIX family)
MSMVVLTVVQHEGRTLLVQEAKERVFGTWNLPGGRVEPREGLAEAAVREAQEEAGVALSLRGLMLIHRGQSISDATQSVTRFIFVGALRDPHSHTLKSQADEHSLRAGWFSRSELAQLPLRNPHVREMIELAALEPVLLPITALRAHFRVE